MKEQINVTEYANQISAALAKGILLNTKTDRLLPLPMPSPLPVTAQDVPSASTIPTSY